MSPPPKMVCVICAGNRPGGWQKSSLRRCHFHEPSTQHYVCFPCVEEHDLLEGTTDWDGMRELKICPFAPEFRIALVLMGKGE